MKIERRITGAGEHPVKLESRAEGETPTIRGYAAMFYDGTPASEYVLWESDCERVVERLLPGAFDNAMARPDDVRGLFNHDANELLGRTKSGTMTLSVDDAGLLYNITPGDTTTARNVRVHLDRGDVSGSSFAFMVDEERWVENKSEDGKVSVLREIISVTLYDVGPVVYPAYEATTAGLRAAGQTEDAKAALAAFRQKSQPTVIPLQAKINGYRARALQAYAEAI